MKSSISFIKKIFATVCHRAVTSWPHCYSHPHLVFSLSFYWSKCVLHRWCWLHRKYNKNEIEEFNDKLYQPSVANIKKSPSFFFLFFLVIKFLFQHETNGELSLRSTLTSVASRIECQKDSRAQRIELNILPNFLLAPHVKINLVRGNF